MSSREVVEEFLASWLVQDVERACALGAEDVVHELHVSNNALPFAGATRGLEACRNMLYSILAEFDYLKYEPVVVGVVGDVVRVQVRFKYHHRRTGENLEGTKRMVFKVRDGLIARVDVYHDASFVEAFMRLVKHREELNEVTTPPEIPRFAAADAPAPASSKADPE